MQLTYHTFVEHRTSGLQDLGTAVFEGVDLAVGGACTCCTGSGCSSCSCTAAIAREADAL